MHGQNHIKFVDTIVAFSLYHCCPVSYASLKCVYVWRLCSVHCNHILITKLDLLPYS